MTIPKIETLLPPQAVKDFGPLRFVQAATKHPDGWQLEIDRDGMPIYALPGGGRARHYQLEQIAKRLMREIR